MSKLTESKEFNALESKAHGYKFKANDWSDWGLLFRFLIIICKLLDKGKEKDKSKVRKPNKWALFLGEQMKAGKTVQEASELWKNK